MTSETRIKSFNHHFCMAGLLLALSAAAMTKANAADVDVRAAMAGQTATVIAAQGNQALAQIRNELQIAPIRLPAFSREATRVTARSPAGSQLVASNP